MADCGITVRVEQGDVCGVVSSLPNGRSYHYFKGIPYALPPVGKLRFEPPVPLAKFASPILDCSKERSRCLQRYTARDRVVGSEDCLFLNVYAPAGPGPYACMVYIHGGGFNTGCGDMVSPEYLIQEDVIVVTFNYRLGPLGFLYLPEAGIHGNAALQDQLLVLKWVNQNISQFNGDPQNVTLFGQSAGAACVHSHVISESSKPFFHKAICQSGTSLMEWALQNNPKCNARKFAEFCGYAEKDDSGIKEFLQSVPVESLTKGVLRQYEVLSDDEIRRGLPLPYRIVVESKDTDGSVLTEQPLTAMKTKDTIQIPMMMGMTDCDGMFFLLGRIYDLKNIDKDISRFIMRSVNMTPHSHVSKLVGEELRKFYFGDKRLNLDTVPEFIDLMTDYFFNVCQHLSIELHAKHQQKSPLYCYRFCYDGGLNLMKRSLRFTQYKGACHADENSYLFLMKGHEDCQLTERDFKMRETICKLWANFAKHGNPTPPADLSIPFKWSPVQPIPENAENFDIDMLNIDENSKMVRNPDKNRIDFWRGVFKTWNGGLVKAKL